MWDIWSTMHGLMYGVIFLHIMCTKLGISFAGDIDNEFGNCVAGGFEVGV